MVFCKHASIIAYHVAALLQDFLSAISTDAASHVKFPLLASMTLFLICHGLDMRPLAVEFPVARRFPPTVGRIDAVFGKSDGTIAIVDFKMHAVGPDKFYLKESLQLLAYGIMLQSNASISVTSLLLVEINLSTGVGLTVDEEPDISLFNAFSELGDPLADLIAAPVSLQHAFYRFAESSCFGTAAYEHTFIWEGSDMEYYGEHEKLARLRAMPRKTIRWISHEETSLGGSFEVNFKQAVSEFTVKKIKERYETSLPIRVEHSKKLQWCTIELPLEERNAIYTRLVHAGYNIAAFSWSIYIHVYLELLNSKPADLWDPEEGP